MAASDLHHGYLRQSQRRSVYEVVYAYSGKSSLPWISGASSLPRRYETLSFTVNDALLVQQLLSVGSLSKPRILEQTPFDSSFSKPIAWADSGMQNVVKYYTFSWLIARQLRSQIWRLPSLCSSGIANLALLHTLYGGLKMNLEPILAEKTKQLEPNDSNTVHGAVRTAREATLSGV